MFITAIPAAMAAAALTGGWKCYRICFYAPPQGRSNPYDPLEGDQYAQIQDTLFRIIGIMERYPAGETLYINGEAVLTVKGVADRKVYVGIRPEGFIPAENGALTCQVTNLEVMGRDVSIVSSNPAQVSAVVRSIVDADIKVQPGEVKYNLKPHKVFIFDAETEERIRFEV